MLLCHLALPFLSSLPSPSLCEHPGDCRWAPCPPCHHPITPPSHHCLTAPSHHPIVPLPYHPTTTCLPSACSTPSSTSPAQTPHKPQDHPQHSPPVPHPHLGKKQ